MGRRRRRRPGAHEEEKNHGHGNSQHVYVDDEGNMVNVRKIGASDEGVLYTMQISVRCIYLWCLTGFSQINITVALFFQW